MLDKTNACWRMFGGPALALLTDPTEATIDSARAAAYKLYTHVHEMPLDALQDKFKIEDVAMTAERLREAVAKLRSTSWCEIHREKFSCTPRGLWDEITKAADTDVERCRARASRLKARQAVAASASLTEEPADEFTDAEQEDFQWDSVLEPSASVATDARSADSLDPNSNPDDFKRMPRKPYNWKHAVDLIGTPRVSRFDVESPTALADLSLSDFQDKFYRPRLTGPTF